MERNYLFIDFWKRIILIVLNFNHELILILIIPAMKKIIKIILCKQSVAMQSWTKLN